MPDHCEGASLRLETEIALSSSDLSGNRLLRRRQHETSGDWDRAHHSRNLPGQGLRRCVHAPPPPGKCRSFSQHTHLERNVRCAIVHGLAVDKSSGHGGGQEACARELLVCSMFGVMRAGKTVSGLGVGVVRILLQLRRHARGHARLQTPCANTALHWE